MISARKKSCKERVCTPSYPVENKLVHLKIGEARGTRSLALNNVKMRHIPDMVYTKLKNLRHLYLSGCGLSAGVPDSLSKLHHLQTLDLSENRLTHVSPDSLTGLIKLTVLDLSLNHLTSLPHTVNHLVSLEELNVSQNKLLTLPDEMVSLVRLRTLDASSNLMRELNGRILVGGLAQSLERLYIGGNLLSYLPREIGALQSLEELDISNNHITYLPATASSLVRLQVLHYTGNPWGMRSQDNESSGSYGNKALRTLYALIYPE